MSKSGHIVILWTMILACVGILRAQDNVTLQFTGQNQNGQYVKLNHLIIENVTKHWQELLYYPDTTFIMGVTGVDEIHGVGEGIRLAQNVPNPFDGVTDFAIQMPRTSQVQLEIYDLNGKVMAAYHGPLDAGCHRFRAWLSAPQTYLLQARSDGGVVQIKMVNAGSSGQNRMEYIGKGNASMVEHLKNDPRGNTTMPFNYGDTMSYTGYTQIANTPFTSAVVKKAQYVSEMIPLTFTLPLPTVTTEAATNIYSTEAWLNGSVIENTEYPVTERGFQLANNEQLTGAVQHLADEGGEYFHCAVHNLQIATRYYFRAYVRTAMGITFGDVVFFDTQAEMPVVQTLAVENITSSSATCGGEVTTDGGANVTARGVCWSTSQSPTINDSYTTDSFGTGVFSSFLTGLSPNTIYYVRAYATNSMGTAYGQLTSFTTLANLPELSTSSVTNITTSSATCGGNVISSGGDIVTARGICWSTSPNPTLNDSHTSDGTGIGYFSSDITGLTAGTTYYVRAYATNSAGTAYGQQTSFTTMDIPVVQTFAVTNITTSSATGGGQVISNGGDIITARGVCWSTSPNPTLNDSHTSDGTGTGYFFSNITGLTVGDTFYVRAYATNSVGTAYGQQVSFTTFLPGVSTGTLTFISTTTAICSGQVTSAGSSNVTSRGVCWSTSQNPTINDSHTTEGSGLGSFTSYIFGLSINTTYYVRAYATNSVGTAYGEQLTITTPPSCGIDTISDYDGNIYHTVPIGQQCWMRENLRTTHFADGAVIPDGSGAASSMQTPYRYIPNGDSLNIPVHGYLYNWPAVMHGANPSNSNPSGVQGICPWGWHIPSETEFNQLVNYLGSQPQYVCGEDNRNVAKALSATTGWQLDADYCTVGNNPQTNNASGFTAFPSGAYYNGFMDFQTSSYFWSATQIVLDGNYNAYQLIIHMHDPQTTTFWCLQRYGASVRCLRN